MSLFKSKFSKLEALAAAKEDERTPVMLAAAQEEHDRSGSGLILIPKSETIKDGAALDKYIEGLEAIAKTAKAEAAAAAKELEELKGKRVVEGAAGSDKGDGGDELGAEAKAEAARTASIHSTDAPWNAKAESMGFTVDTTATA